MFIVNFDGATLYGVPGQNVSQIMDSALRQLRNSSSTWPSVRRGSDGSAPVCNRRAIGVQWNRVFVVFCVPSVICTWANTTALIAVAIASHFGFQHGGVVGGSGAVHATVHAGEVVAGAEIMKNVGAGLAAAGAFKAARICAPPTRS
jgi:hypothetical protein